MLSIKKVTAGTVAMVLLLATALHAGNRKTGINGATFLKIGVGAKQISLGSAVTTMSGDPNMMFWNPAGIVSESGKTAFAFNHNRWLLAMNHEALAITHKIEGSGTLGLGVIYVGLGDIVADRDIAPTEDTRQLQADQATSPTYSFYDVAINLTIAHQFTDKLTLGASLKFIREKIDDQTASSVAADFGVIYRTGFRDLTLGARMNNLGGDIEYYSIPAPIPLLFSIGASMTLAGEENSRLIGYLDATKPQDNPQLYFGGLEWRLMERLSIRGGYKFAYSGTKDRFNIDITDEGASFGAGLKLPWGDNSIFIDYAFTQFNVLSNTHRFSFYIEF